MKSTIRLGCIVSLVLIGCGQNPPKPPQVTSNAVAAPVDPRPAQDKPSAKPSAKTPVDPAAGSTKPTADVVSSKGEPIDLTERYLVPMETLIKSPQFPWRDCPRGEITLGNVPLKIGGFITLWGERNAQKGQPFPESYTGIKVGRKFDALYVYDTSFHIAKDGTPIAKLIFQYADGTSAETEICFGTHCRDWWQDAKGPEDVTDAKSKCVWNGLSSLAPADRPLVLQFFISEIANPNPKLEVATIDLVSSKGPCALCLMAMTTGPAGLLKVETPFDEKEEPKSSSN